MDGKLKCFAFVAGSALALGCAGSQDVDPTNARAAVYSTGFNELFQEVALEVRQHYPNLAAKPDQRLIQTAWHQLPFARRIETKEEQSNPRTADPLGSAESAGAATAGFDQRRAHRRENTRRETKNFVRFDVQIEAVGSPGSNQWRVTVRGQASEHDGTGIPVELTGAARPYWLDGRIAELEVVIYERVKGMSVVAPATAEEATPATP